MKFPKQSDMDWDIQEQFGVPDPFEYSCPNPGKNGCGLCDACEDYEARLEINQLAARSHWR